MVSLRSSCLWRLARWIWYYLHPRAIRWRYIKKRNPDKPIITMLGKDLKVRIYPYDFIGGEIYVNGIFEKAEAKFVTKFLKPGMVFFDIGANFGQYTLFGAKCVGPNGKVHSFEPSNRMFAELTFNVGINGFSDICILNNVALSNKEGIARLSKYENGCEVYGSLGNQNRLSDSFILGYEEVKTVTIDSYIQRHNINHVDFVKMDIEGAELLVLKGANELLNRADSPTIVLEMADINTDGFGYKAIEIWDYLENLDYSLYCFDKKGEILGQAKRPKDFVRVQNLVAMKS